MSEENHLSAVLYSAFAVGTVTLLLTFFNFIPGDIAAIVILVLLTFALMEKSAEANVGIYDTREVKRAK